MMALGTCEHCNKVVREENFDAHMIAEHPAWALEQNTELTKISGALERIASALEDVAAALDRNKLQGYGNFDGK